MTSWFEAVAPLDADEQKLATVEQFWADCANFFRTGTRLQRGGRDRLRCMSLADVHHVLEGYRAKHEAGSGLALLNAIKHCADENLPMPYWLADEFRAVHARLHAEPGSLHSLLGLDEVLPANGKKAATRRTQNQLAIQLYGEVSLLAQRASLSDWSALVEVLKRPEFKHRIQLRTAWKLYVEARNLQKRLRPPTGKMIRQRKP